MAFLDSGWHWLLLFFFILSLVFFYLIAMGGLVYLKSQRISPRIKATFFDDHGKIIEERALKETIPFTSEWQMPGSNPGKIKFNVLARGIGFAEPREYDANDYMEMRYSHGDKVRIFFNLTGLNATFAADKLKMIKRINKLQIELRESENDYKKLLTHKDDIVDKELKRTKILTPFSIQKPASKK